MEPSHTSAPHSLTPLLVLGAQGQVARGIAKIAGGLGFEPTLAGRETLDLLHDSPAALIERTAPAAVINAAAFTAVDRAEQEPDAAFRLNAEVPGLIAQACAGMDIPFIHISTDYVFDGAKAQPYLEDDVRRPLGVYGASKAAGEQTVEAVAGRSAIVRTAWVYSADGANFLKTMLRLAQGRDEIGVVADRHGCPTWAEDVARACLRLALGLLDHDARARGLFHAVGGGEASWAEFAEAIFAESAARGGPVARVRRITTADYPTPARRPVNSRLAGDRLALATGWRLPPWRESLAACLDELAPADALASSRA